MKQEVIMIRIPKELKQTLKAAAEQMGVGLSTYIRIVLMEKATGVGQRNVNKAS